MKKEIDAKYYDAVISRNKAHAEKWAESGRRGSVVILERRDHAKQNAARVDLSSMPKGERATGDNVQPRDGDTPAERGYSPIRRGRPRKEQKQ